MYRILVISLVVVPVASVAVEWLSTPGAALLPIVGKWFVFWTAGVRLLLAGIRQVAQPAFTAREIFRMKTDEALPVIRELGFANLAVGLLGVVSLHATSFVLPVAIAGAIFYGAAGAQHVTQKDRTGNETLAMATDLFAFAALSAYVLHVWTS